MKSAENGEFEGIVFPGFYPNKGQVRPVHINDRVDTGQLRNASYDLTRVQYDVATECMRVISEAESVLGSNLSSAILNQVVSQERLPKKLTRIWQAKEVTLTRLLSEAITPPKEVDLEEQTDEYTVTPIVEPKQSALEAVKNYWNLYGMCSEYLLTDDAFKKMGTLQLSLTSRFVSRAMRNAIVQGVYTDIV
jgi:hypothetical protein